MIKLTYTPWKPTFADSADPSPVQELTMTIGDSVTWDEATTEFHNFLRGAGYVIPYDFEEEEDHYFDCSDPPDRDKSGSLGDRQPEWANSMSGDYGYDDDFYDQTALELCNKCGWKTVVPDDGCLNCKRREWVGITNEDYEVGEIYSDKFLEGVDWAEEKLKEKNT